MADLRLPIWWMVIALIGCDADRDDPKLAVAPPVVAGTGIVRGKVRFTGTPPVMKTIENRPCHELAEPINEEFVIVNDNGTLRNVFVCLEGAPASDGSTREPVLLDQVNCRYVPHVLGVLVGQRIRVRSSDPTLHNVHCLATKNRAVNFGMTGAGDQKTISFERSEFIPVKCDVHPWMIAYVGVFENPWFAVTDDQGRFEITGIPAGSYQLVTWHEQYGRLEQTVAVSDDRPVAVELEYRQESR